MTALDQLYLQTGDPLAAAANLAGLAAGATLGELGSLEEVVAHLMRGDLISHMTIKVSSEPTIASVASPSSNESNSGLAGGLSGLVASDRTLQQHCEQ